jgi:NAD-dependent dihydropyrimidine dehydrogenase PreA subunit/flavodoxin
MYICNEKQFKNNTMILYFSGTGNSLAVAKHLAEHLGEQIMPLYIAVDADLSQEKRIGFVYPCYNFNAPHAVKETVPLLRLPKQAYCFVVIACGAQAGDSVWAVERVLREQGLRLNYCHKIRVPDNSAIAFGRNPNDQTWKFERFAPRLAQITSDITAGKTGKHFGSRGVLGMITALPSIDKQISKLFQIASNTDKCIGCSICAKVCPVGNISIVEGKAVNGENCNYCLGCVHFCPHQAMEINGKPTEKERQYHHPKVSLKDMVM